MFKEVKNFKREDLKSVAIEISEDVPPDANIAALKNIILNSDEYKADPDFVKSLLENAISERKIQEEAEKERIKLEAEKEKEKEFKLEEAKLNLEKAKLEEEAKLELEKTKLEEERKYNLEIAKMEHELELAKIRNQEQSQIENQPATVENGNSRRKFTLPKLEFRRFGDDIKEWLPFWSQFERIDQDEDIANEDKFQYLIQATIPGSRAREVVESFPPTSANYSKAIESLKTRFGREDLLVEVYVRELLKLIISVQSKHKFSPTSLYDKLESYLRALETLGVTKDKCASILYPMVESCFPEEFLKAWNRSTISSGKEAKERLIDLMDFLKLEVEGEERIGLAMAGFGLSKNEDTRLNKKKKHEIVEFRNKAPSAASLLLASNPEVKNKCIFCEGKHKSSECFSAQKMSINEKQNVLKAKHCCFACLMPGHSVKNCRTFLKCVMCEKKHVPLMCDKIEAFSKLPPKEEENAVKNDVNLSNLSQNPKVFLQTLKAQLISGNKVKDVRLLFDSGSQKSYVLKDVAQSMYSPTRQESVTHILFGGVSTTEYNHKCYTISLKNLNSQYKCNFEVLDQDVICENILPVGKGSWLQELKVKNIVLTDIGNISEPIEILIGADIMGKLLTGRKEVLSTGLVAIETYLGWTLMGKVPQSDLRSDSLAMTVTNLFVRDADIADLWKLDAIGIKDPIEKKSKLEQDFLTKKHFEETVRFNEESRYEISLPWSDGCPTLPDNMSLAKKRLEVTTSRLTPKLYQDYENVLLEWMKEGIIEEVPETEVNFYGIYLPHRPVIKESSSTTPIRPVFDASARMANHPSLNQCLESGPNLIELIPDILLRFRERKIGVTADIKKAFLQISVCKADRDFLRFLWWENQEQKRIKVFRHARVVFGVKCSPFLLGAVIEHHVNRSECCDSNFKEKLLKSYYVDNVVTSVDSEEDLDEFRTRSKDVMLKGGFELRGWENSELNCKSSENHETPIVGLIWNRLRDTLRINMSWLKEVNLQCLTKRVILSVAHKVYDPIGYTSPVMLCPKLLLQEAWKNGIGWDEEVTGVLKDRFLQWFNVLKFLDDIHIPRWIQIAREDLENCEIHCFCDASKDAFAAVVYLRIEKDDKTELCLLSSKARIAPLKGGTIPRLELLAALIGARLTKSVLDALGWEDVKCYYWSDSTTVLAWISREENWSVFVRNRVQEIRKLSSPSSWQHVPGEINPGDLPSRGCNAKQLLELSWWEGPHWLKESRKNWSHLESNETSNEEEIAKERLKSATLTNFEKNEKTNWYYQHFSKYEQIIRLICWIRRFIGNCSSVKEDRIYGEISALEYEKAELEVVKLIQQESLTRLENKKLKNLSTYTDEEGVVRVKTQIIYRKDKEDFRKPVLLPASHEVVSRLIRFHHEKNSHCGVQMLLNILREKYWILNGKKTVRKIISKCTICSRFSSRKLESTVSPLPENRVRDAAVFQITGVDAAGPLYMKDNSKAWVLIFTCAIYRAVHLELVSSASTETFLMALRRFVARRGRCSIIYCDNGTNFVGAANCLRLLDWNKIVKHGAINDIQWKFNPPTAAWWGGWWERLIRIMKDLLKRVLGRALLSQEEMLTVLCDCESLMNSRPLTYISENNEDPVPLSPSMFLQDIHEWRAPDLDAVDQKSLNRRVKYRQALQVDLRNRFRSEYLGLLVQKNRKADSRTVAVGDIVLVGTDNTKRIDWPLGRVVELLPGSDGNVRLVRVQTAHSKLLRPIQRIYPLEVSSKSDIVNCRDQLNKKMKVPKKDVTNDTTEQLEPHITKAGRRVKIPERLNL